MSLRKFRYCNLNGCSNVFYSFGSLSLFVTTAFFLERFLAKRAENQPLSNFNNDSPNFGGNSKMNRKSLQILLLILCLAVSAAAQVNLNAPIPVDPNVRIGKLDNGLTYYIRKNSKPENKV